MAWMNENRLYHNMSQYVHEIEALLKYIKKEVIDRDLWNEPDRV
ncbi:hypothetical protein AVP43_02796 [Geobacillus stearothermophilus]|nr:hypothetical protein AVP43_02796 [Geobacillus stearothermophilus]